MYRYLKKGWQTTLRHPYLLTFLFIYEIAWSFALFKLVQPIIREWMLHFPSNDLSPVHSRLFVLETYVQITKTTLAHPYLYGIASIVLLRMLVTPIINSIIYHSIHKKDTQTTKLQLKHLFPSFIFYYLLQNLILLLPLRWLIPDILSRFQQEGTLELSALSWAMIVMYLLAYAVFILLIRLWFMYIQFGKTAGHGWLSAIFSSFQPLFKQFVRITAISLFLLLILFLLTSMTQLASLIWAGMASFIFMFTSKLIKCVHRLLEITTQYHIHSTGTAKIDTH